MSPTSDPRSAARTTAEAAGAAGPGYQCGFGNHFASEAVAGALPIGRNSPQRPPYGLYAELLSGSAFTAPRAESRRTWTYRIRPSAAHGPFVPLAARELLTAPLADATVVPDRLRWSPLPLPAAPTDFVDGLFTLGANGDAGAQRGIGIHVYRANRSMHDRAIYDADGELLVVPQLGRLRVVTELGVLEAGPGEIVLLPRGLRFSVALPDGEARGYVCENHGAPFRLPELGPIGSNGLASPRDFLAPVAAFDDRDRPCEMVAKLGGRLWSTRLGHSPFDVVAWHGNLVPCKYDLSRFMAIGTVSFDHPDPSIFTVLTSPSDIPGTANADFVIFPPRWMVAEDTFRPPWFHRNAMSEFMGLIAGVYDAKAEGFLPGGASLHNAWSAHGPDAATHARASSAPLEPQRIDGTMAFMFETRLPVAVARQALDAPELQRDYWQCWQGLGRRFGGTPG